MKDADFHARYGPWAVVAGGSDGLGAEFARQLAGRGLSLVLVARRTEPLTALASEIASRFAVETVPLSLDLADPRGLGALVEETERLDVGLLVCNGALSLIGPYLREAPSVHERLIDLNCRAPALLSLAFGARMQARGRGGIILVSSMAGFRGTALVSHYAASKAYVRVLAEGLWDELRPSGVDVLACCAGLTETPTFRSGSPRRPGWLALPVMGCESAVRQTLGALGRGPEIVPGRANRLASRLAALLPRRAGIALSGAGTRAMYPSVALGLRAPRKLPGRRRHEPFRDPGPD